jgi:hypothetical protein
VIMDLLRKLRQHDRNQQLKRAFATGLMDNANFRKSKRIIVTNIALNLFSSFCQITLHIAFRFS